MISQKRYTKSILARLGMAGYNPAHMTGARGNFASVILTKHGYCRLHGNGTTPIYHGVPDVFELCTRCYITYAVNQLARARSKPSKLHMAVAKHLFRYLKGNMSLTITFETGCFQLTAFGDAS